jgi:hypothetical protein
MLGGVGGANRQGLSAWAGLAKAEGGQRGGAETFKGNGRFSAACYGLDESAQFLSMPFVQGEVRRRSAAVIGVKPRAPKVIGNRGSSFTKHLDAFLRNAGVARREIEDFSP